MLTFENFGYLNDKEILLFRLQNASGAYVELSNYGGAIVSIVAPDRDGEKEHVVLGFDEPQGYLEDKCYIGSTIGRFANRIANAAFKLEGRRYILDANDNVNSNHSGNSGYNYRLFDYKMDDDSLTFTLCSPDSDGGFPGNLELTVIYQWTEKNQLKITYLAETDKPTIANFTNHAYFNLAEKDDNMLNHRLTINGRKVLEADKNYIPTGEIIVAGTKAFSGEKIKDKMETNGQGFNDYYILDDSRDKLKLAATLDYEDSGRRLNIYTTYPGLMFYTGDFLESIQPGHAGRPYKPFDGLCLECQHYPDAPNHSDFPSTALKPVERYEEQIVYEFTLISNE